MTAAEKLTKQHNEIEAIKKQVMATACRTLDRSAALCKKWNVSHPYDAAFYEARKIWRERQN